jgi:hypothetical protein
MPTGCTSEHSARSPPGQPTRSSIQQSSLGARASGNEARSQHRPISRQFPAATSSTIFLNASGGNIRQPLPSSQRNFASAGDFASFLLQNLNATPIYDGAGNVVGATVSLLQSGETYYVDANNALQTITDPISAFIGGVQGQFTVAAVTYQTGLQGQDRFFPTHDVSAPGDVTQCNAFGECISGHSWNTHWIGHIKDSVGVAVRQETGGFQRFHSQIRHRSDVLR